jgi:hypothetical protein
MAAAHTAEVNCTPRSEVMIAGRPNCMTQPEMNASAMSVAAMVFNGTASNLCPKNSTGNSAAVMREPGRLRGAPSTSSAAETPESSRGAALMPNRTQGR